MSMYSFLRFFKQPKAKSRPISSRPRRTILRLEELEARETPAAPTISAIGKQFENMNTPLAIPFTVAETGFPSANIMAFASSSNTTVIPNAGLAVTPPVPTDGHRTLTITPANNQTGVSTVTVIALGQTDSSNEDVPVGGGAKQSGSVQIGGEDRDLEACGNFRQCAGLGGDNARGTAGGTGRMRWR